MHTVRIFSTAVVFTLSKLNPLGKRLKGNKTTRRNEWAEKITSKSDKTWEQRINKQRMVK